MPLISGIYVAAAAHGMPSILMRAVICAICLLPPTILMGASLPAAARWLKTSAEGVSWMGLLYGANTAGAVFGCLLAGFYLLRVSDMATATFVAAAVNVAVALASFLLARLSPHTPGDEVPPLNGVGASGYWPVYAAIAFSGAGALGAEVVWTRLLGLMLGATVYTFFHHSVDLSGGSRHRQRRRLHRRALPLAPPRGPGLVPDGPRRHRRLDRLAVVRFASLLAD